tara:strand:+ start:1298 stop:2692 length:1395 start_codon:yes stop_codon:yes gene_type:complete
MTRIDKPEKLPSVDRLLNDPDGVALVCEFGTPLVTRSVKAVLARARTQVLAGITIEYGSLLKALSEEVTHTITPSLRPVINLTGTVLHTNLGRAALPESAIKAVADVARGASNLEFDLETGKRGNRHKHTEDLLCYLTGAEAALVVNNNAAAVLLTLNSLAKRKEVPVSRGELIEIGGAFRMPDIMVQAGCKLVEVGTTNRTHDTDFELAIGPKTALLMKVHASNFEIRGFAKSVCEQALAEIAHRHNLPLVTDLGSGTLVDLKSHQLPHETTVAEALGAGADLVTFSGDKLLGGPQAGIVAGRRDLITKLKRNPMTRAMRPDKLTLAALHAVLRLYTNPSRLAMELPTLRLLSRDYADIAQLAARMATIVQDYCEGFEVIAAPVQSQIGSGALPNETLASVALKLTVSGKRRPGKTLIRLAKAFRDLPIPVIGRITDDALWFDVRCLEDEDSFIENLKELRVA